VNITQVLIFVNIRCASSEADLYCVVPISKHSIVHMHFSTLMMTVQLSIARHYNTQWLGFVVPENKGGKIANYNIHGQF